MILGNHSTRTWVSYIGRFEIQTIRHPPGLKRTRAETPEIKSMDWIWAR